MRTYRFLVGKAEAGLRLDRYLLRHLPQTFSRAVVQRSIQACAVTVDGRTAKAHRHLKAGETVVARFDQLSQPSREAALAPEPIPPEVVYEDDEVLVVNKPPGLVTHPAPGHWSGTLVNAILWHLQQAQGSRLKAEGKSLEPPASSLQPVLPRAGIVHRLDKDTSGLLLVAKTQRALRALTQQLKARSISRRYLALVEGHAEFQEGTIDASIGRHLKDRKVMTVRYLGGRQAVTHYRVIKRLEARGSRLEALDKSLQPPASSLEPEAFPYTLLEVWLETGRTHQVRVHLAHLGHPVLGDPVYGRHPTEYWSALGIPRQLLHAYAIRFVHPATQKPLELTIGLPEDMMRWVPQELRDVSILRRLEGA